MTFLYWHNMGNKVTCVFMDYYISWVNRNFLEDSRRTHPVENEILIHAKAVIVSVVYGTVELFLFVCLYTSNVNVREPTVALLYTLV